jgi:UDP-glucose 4-epimerase
MRMRIDVPRRMMVVGGAGFVGHHLVGRLVRDGHEVVVVDDFSRGSRAHLAGLDSARLRIVEADVTEPDVLGPVLEQACPEVIFHLAAIHFIPYCAAHPSETLRVNVLGTQHLLDALAVVPTARVVIASTADVYAPAATPHVEDDPVTAANVYGVSKLTCEHLLALARRRHPQARFLAARLFNVFGRGETNPHVLPDILAWMRRGEPLRLGNLEPRRDYVHGSDVADAFVRLAGYDGSHTVFNVGTGIGTSVGELVATLAAVCGRRLEIRQDPAKVRPVERPHLVADATRLREVLGWQPRVDLRAGLRDLLDAEPAAARLEAVG